MKNTIILHGRPGKQEYYLRKILRKPNSRAHWIDWLSRELKSRGIKVDAPEIPKSYDPKWDIWVKHAEKSEIGPETTLIGHSTGAGFWIRYLSEHKELKVGKVILVAPWLGYDYGAPPTDFFKGYKIDPDLAKRTKELVIFYSDNDMDAVQKSVAELKAILKGAKYREFHGYGHFTLAQMRTNKFPELLEECLAGNT
ncbi:MAG: alpha/beta hydrolase [Candidatus Saccharimonadales bacterium]